MKIRSLNILRFLLLAGTLSLPFQPASIHAEAMLQLFNTSWKDLAAKMPELAEAGYTSLWLPPPTKGSGGLSVGYDCFDGFDLGSKDQRSSVSTRYGTEVELLKMVEVAHRFGIRIYFDNIMNHRAFDIPGYDEKTSINVYPGMVPEDFHLRVTEDGFYRKWDNTRDWSSAWQVQNLGLADLVDIAQETPNANFGKTEGSTSQKYSFVRQPNNPEYYAYLPNGTYVGFGPTNGITTNTIAANLNFYKEDVGAFLIRNVRWMMDRTKADGLRLDAVKHVPDYFFGMQSGADKDSSDAGYLGGIQRQFNLTRGFSDANHRDSVFDTEKGRDDAMVFGEHLGSPPAYGGYWDAGMRLVDNDLRSKLNGVLGNPSATLAGLDSSGGGGFAASLGVMHATSHDNDYAAQRQLQHAMYYTREGLGLVYSDGNTHSQVLGDSGGAFPRNANTAYLGQWSDPRIPNLAKINGDFARGYQSGLWGDADFLAYERRDNRNPDGSTATRSASDDVTMVVMLNDNTASGVARTFTSSFPTNAYLYQYATGPNGSYQVGFYKYGNELSGVVVPAGGYYIFGYRTPELSTLWPDSAITLYQNGVEAPKIYVTRKDGPDGDSTFNPAGLTNRGFDSTNDMVAFTYRTKVPVVNGGSPLTLVARADGSAENILLKLDGGVDLNGTVPSGITDPAKRDNPPAVRTDTFLGYEQPTFRDRQHPEKFAAVDTTHCQTGSPGAETYVKTIGGTFTINNGPTSANDYGTAGGNVASWIYHDPANAVGGTAGTTGVGGLQFVEGTSDIVIWAKSNSVGGGFKMFVYYTTDGTYPEGAGGIGRGTTQVTELNWRHNDSGNDWWGSASISKPAAGIPFAYKIGAYKTGASFWWPSDAVSVAYKKTMLTTFSITNFQPTNVQYHLHNDYNSLTTGLQEGFHIVRARAFLKRDNQSPLYQTFFQTFYYDAQTPGGSMPYPQVPVGGTNTTVGGSSYEVVIRADSTVTEVWAHIDDSDSSNDDALTKAPNGNGAGGDPFVDANGNGQYDAGETFTDLNGNGIYDASITAGAWVLVGEVAPSVFVGDSLPREFRFRYKNIPSDGMGTIHIRFLEASSSHNFTLDSTAGHYTELLRPVDTRGPLMRMNIAWPQRDGDTVGDNYTMKVYLSYPIADNLTQSEILSRMTFSIASTESGTDRGAVDQSLTTNNTSMSWSHVGANGDFRELGINLPNLYNDQPNFLHRLRVTYADPVTGVTLEEIRFVKAYPTSKPFIAITSPPERDSDGKTYEITLPDGPGADSLRFAVQVQTSTSVTSVSLVGNPAITVLNEVYIDTNFNGKFDGQEPYIDANSNGIHDTGEIYTDLNENGVWDANEQPSLVDTNGNGTWDGITVTLNTTSKVWDIPWMITSAGTYQLTATGSNGTDSSSASRTARVILREPSGVTDADSDNDGLTDTDEATAKALPTTTSDGWTNGDVHAHYAFGNSLPTCPDSDGDGLPDGLELGWRTASNPPTDTTADTNGDGYPNFIGDMDPPLYAVVENAGTVPGVGSLSLGDDRSRQAAGSVTDPTNPDTDGDGILDGVVVAKLPGWVAGD
ncbi:MAG: alpha-amylase family glycosyl hydrolase, partial [Verrucomicrobia bacterium]|nr:alpha-amylase family glycosyl hydrolase [Verrucomicrobiota bacterium]